MKLITRFTEFSYGQHPSLSVLFYISSRVLDISEGRLKVKFDLQRCVHFDDLGKRFLSNEQLIKE